MLSRHCIAIGHTDVGDCHFHRRLIQVRVWVHVRLIFASVFGRSEGRPGAGCLGVIDGFSQWICKHLCRPIVTGNFVFSHLQTKCQIEAWVRNTSILMRYLRMARLHSNCHASCLIEHSSVFLLDEVQSHHICVLGMSVEVNETFVHNAQP